MALAHEGHNVEASRLFNESTVISSLFNDLVQNNDTTKYVS